MTSLKQSVSLCALAVALGCGASPALAQQSSATPQTPGPATAQPATPDQPSSTSAQPSTGQSAPTTPASPQPLANSNAAAPDTGAAQSLSVVVVTGTRVARPNITSASPIVTVTADEIADQGATSVTDILNRLPQVAPDNQLTYQDSTGVQQVQLRGLGFNRTLSLIDGERISTSEGVNVNAIPVALIDHIDVLTGGASSVYGADAVAGVINFILKKNFDGLTVSGGYSFYEHDNDGENIGAQTASAEGYPVPHGPTVGGGNWNFNVAAGHSFDDNKINIESFAGYVSQEPIKYSSRDFSSCYLTQNGQVNTAPACYTQDTQTPEGSFTPQTGPNAGTTFSNNINGSQTFVPTSYSTPTNPDSAQNLVNQYDRYTGGIFINFKATPHFTYYMNYMASYQVSINSFNQVPIGQGDTYSLNCNNPLMSAQQLQTLCGTQAGTSASAPTVINYQPAGTFDDEYTNLDQRIATGFKGDFLDNAFKYDVNYVYSTFANEQRGNTSGGDLDTTNLTYALNNCSGAPTGSGCLPVNIFQTGAKALTGAQWNYIEDNSVRGKEVNEGALYDDTINLTADLGKFGIKSPYAKDGLAVNLGGEFRVDREVNTCDSQGLYQLGCGDFSLSQNVKEVYAELGVPLIQDNLYTHLLSFNGSYRASKYTISPTIFSTWDYSGVYSPVKDITFRASWNKASREPTVYEYGSGIPTFSGGGADPCAGVIGTPTAAQIKAGITEVQDSLKQCEAQGVTAAEYGNLAQCGNSNCLAESGLGHPNPETAHTLTYGFITQPRWIPRLTLSADYFDIVVDDQISYSYASSWEQGCALYQIAYYCDHIIRNANGTLTSYQTYENNKGATPTTGFVTYGNFNQYKDSQEGYDFQGQYTVPIAQIHGSLNFNFNGTWTILHGGQGGPGQYVNNSAGYFGSYAGIPRPKWEHTLRSTYTSADKFYSVSANWRHIGTTDVTNDSGTPALGAGPNGNPYLYTFNKIPAYNYMDLSTTFHFEHKYTLVVSCNNVLDRNPPIFPDAYSISDARDNTIPQTYDLLGRQFAINATAAF